MKILFLCTANSCRSILSEAVFNHMAPEGMQAYSAGSQPKGHVHPLSLKTLEKAGISTRGLYSKASDVFDDLHPDIVITVCDKAAGEACPLFFGPAIKSHWGLEDPSDHTGSPADMEAAFVVTMKHIATRIEALLTLPLDQLDHDQLKLELDRIGHI